MFGMQNKTKPEKFAFDLEKEIKTNQTRNKEIQAKIEARVNEIKSSLREGQKDEDFDRLGVLLHGYAALQKVLKKAAKK
jgi:hypothetical protein